MHVSLEQIETWELIGTSPARGKVYFSIELDMCAVVYRAINKVRVYHDRSMPGKLPYCFEEWYEI